MTTLVCKFDAEHGSFATPVTLRRHYDEQHADEYTASGHHSYDYRCRVCGGVFRNSSSHMMQRHPDMARPHRQYVDRLDRVTGAVLAAGTYQPDAGTAAVERVNGHAVHEPPAPPRRDVHVGPWDVDDVVLPVIEQLAAPKGLIPVAHLAAILAWREATAVMLETVSGRGRG